MFERARIGRYASVAVFGAVAMLALPSPASAGSGWKLPKVQSKEGKRIFTSVAWTCGQSRFGVYRFVNGARVKGRWKGSVVFKVRLTADGRAHRPRFRRFRGNLPKKLRKRTRRVLRRTQFRYNPGPPARVESLWAPTKLQASLPVQPSPGPPSAVLRAVPASWLAIAVLPVGGIVGMVGCGGDDDAEQRRPGAEAASAGGERPVRKVPYRCLVGIDVADGQHLAIFATDIPEDGPDQICEATADFGEALLAELRAHADS